MLEVILDTNVLIHAVLNNLQHEDCFEVIKLIRTNKIKPVTSPQLLREYMTASTKVVINKLAEHIKKNGFDDKFVIQALSASFDCSSSIMDIIGVHKAVKVTSKEHICSLDPEDDKIVNLAIDSNCDIIITENISDFKDVEEKRVKTKNGKPITVYTSKEFCSYYYGMYIKLKQFERKSKP